MEIDPASREILRSSSLAKAICTLFKAISNSRIAHIDLTPKVSFWVQIPTPTSISSLPDATEPQIPGIWLTTATAIPTHDELLTTGHKLASHFGLLLLTDIQSILASVSLNSRIRPVLEQYLNHTIPTKSFLQISQKAKVALDDVTIMASHLIHWRQARIIPPLHKKDTYIVSPNADMRRLRSSALQFQRDFPLQPSLNTILSRLNSANRPYKAIIPNKDHQEAYMSILAWLMRYGWVTQIRTFGWVRVPGHVRQAVEDEIQRETHRIQHEDEWNKKTATKSINFNTSNRNDERSLVGIEDPTNDERHLTVSPGLLAPSIMSSESSESRASMSSTLTAVPIFGQPHSSSILGQTPRSALLISSPTEASGVQRRYLEYVSSTIGRTGGPEVRDAWNRCLPFFDGQHALEQIPAREGWKRSWMEGLRAGWIKDGWLREGKSW